MGNREQKTTHMGNSGEYEPGAPSWLPVGEDNDTLYADGHLPKDWHTVAHALLNCSEGLDDRYECLEWWEAYRAKKVRVVHGWECWAPPGEWYGGSCIKIGRAHV